MFRPSRTFILLLTLSILVPGALTSAQPGMDSPWVDSIILRGLELVYVDSTFEAVDEFKKLIGNFPDDPIGYFYVSASLQTMMDDFRNYSYAEEFDRYMDTAIKKAEKKKF